MDASGRAPSPDARVPSFQDAERWPEKPRSGPGRGDRAGASEINEEEQGTARNPGRKQQRTACLSKRGLAQPWTAEQRWLEAERGGWNALEGEEEVGTSGARAPASNRACEAPTSDAISSPAPSSHSGYKSLRRRPCRPLRLPCRPRRRRCQRARPARPPRCKTPPSRSPRHTPPAHTRRLPKAG